MISHTLGDISRADAEAIVNTVNCVGVMGRGVALQIKKEFPKNFKAYKTACERDEVQPGKMFVFETNMFTNPKYIINFPTKKHWRNKSRMEDIESGLEALVDTIRYYNIRSIAIPALGSGNGGLDWNEVLPRIETALRVIPNLQVTIFRPDSTAIKTKSRNAQVMTPGRAALVVLMNRYLVGLMDPFVSLLVVHKLMYFMQEAGEPLHLRYVKEIHGPYAENLDRVLNAVEGHLVSGYADGDNAPDKQLELLPGAVKVAESFLADKRDTLSRFGRVDQLVKGFETSLGLELLATVHWVITRENATGLNDVINKVYDWSKSKKERFTPRQIKIAFETLQSKDWLVNT
ncbi:MAG: macro domain-containing protein [Hyphomicrobiales bacterium]|nr:macro domain-containing protein [Hyphomicrobiales bacterium]